MNEAERINAIKLIYENYTSSKIDYFDLASKSGLKITNVYKIDIEGITAKRKIIN